MPSARLGGGIYCSTCLSAAHLNQQHRRATLARDYAAVTADTLAPPGDFVSSARLCHKQHPCANTESACCCTKVFIVGTVSELQKASLQWYLVQDNKSFLTCTTLN